MNILFVALGGALGAGVRYPISLIPSKTKFPILTLLVTLSGALLLGVMVGLIENIENVSRGLVVFLKDGVCMGYILQSTFSIEARRMNEMKERPLAIAYRISSFLCCIIGMFLGISLTSIFR